MVNAMEVIEQEG